ncbi:U32 family peptidase [Sedimentibacter sp.]|uniref:U32 family peptidase n=1 Tax=Sedimentibacter sp. TaxID=1960295 RepID=UPI0028A74046|nr:U32 family peptidase [Sedimentibacter sp.]
MIRKAELLAPAGSIESFYAAVNSGADSVYLGGKLFNARHNSQNFDDEQMKHVIKYAHNKNVKVYVTLNIILKDTEIFDALRYAEFLYENDVDAVIVQDLGLLYLLKKYMPALPVNISTQGAVYDEYGVKFFEQYNVQKVILAREMSLAQLRETVKNTDADLEIFIHGALCTCYSGQCYMSSFLGGRSGNRGKCAQPCRLNYSFYDKEKGELSEEFNEAPVLSLKDFMAGETVHELIDAGIATFKIEGRMKGPLYTSEVVKYYGQIIDDYYKGTQTDISTLRERAVSTFSRGYTNSYLKPNKDDEMFARLSSGVKGENIDEIEEENNDIAHEFSEYKRNVLKFEIKLKIGEKAELLASDGKNNVLVKSEEPCESSLKNAVTEDIIKEQLGKLGNTIYELRELKIEKQDNVFIRKSTLNQLRRAATELLYEKGAIVYNREPIHFTRNEVFSFDKTGKISKPKISVKINSDEDFNLIDNHKVDRIYVPYNLNLDLAGKISIKEKYLFIPNIVSMAQYNEFKSNLKLYEEIFDGVCVNNAGSFYFFKQNSSLKIHCGSFFNVINSFSTELLKENGAVSLTLSAESNIRDMESINNNTSIKTEIKSHEYLQLMVMKNCPMSLIKNCKNLQDCSTCEHRNKYSLKDRKGVYFNIERDNRLTHIYNSVPLSILGKTEDFADKNIDYFMVDTKWLDNTEDVIDTLYCEINGVKTANILKENSFTRGHYLKNIL